MEHSLYEGGADFIAELATGKHINRAAHSFGDKHAAQLWKIFSSEADEPYEHTAGWLYGGSPIDGGPNDLGYYVGYKICESYYARADNKQTAVYDILNIKDARQFLQSSRFEERFLSPSELAPPKIVSTSPADGDQGVDPETQQIKIEFSLPMDGRYSINPVDAAFPQVTGLKWNDQKTQLTLSVELEPMTRYQLTFNSHQHKGFASQRGKVLAPHMIEFTTK